MRPLPLFQIAEWTDGALIQGTPADTLESVSTDSRRAGSGDLFIALKGENHDGHAFIGQVSEAGVPAILVSALPPSTESFRGGIIRVKDTLVALQQLARRHRLHSRDLFVVGVTGSNGKTSTKDFLATVLERAGGVNATAGNLNNHIGLPLTILAGREADRHAVWEMGMNHPGEIGMLADIARPDAAVITTIGTAHIEHMGSREAIAAEKASLAEAVPPGGFCAMPARDDFYDFVRSRVRCEMVPVGIGVGAVRAESLAADADGRMTFDLVSDIGSAARVSLPVRGEHMVVNALLAAAVGLRRGLDSATIADALSQVRLTGGRLQEKQIRGFVVIDDSYNANPDSMQAALRTLRSASVNGRRVAVLGFMGELGEHERSEHRRLGERVAEAGLDLLVTVGERASLINETAGPVENRNFSSHEEAADFLRPILDSGDLVLVKGSRSAKMERVIEALNA